MAVVEINYDKLERFLRGEVSPEDLSTRQFNRYDITVIAYALAVAHLKEVTYEREGMIILKQSFSDTLNKYCPYYIYSSHVTASKELQLHKSHGRGHETMELTPPAKLVELVEKYKDLPHGGIATFTARKLEENKDHGDIDGITPDDIAVDVIARLRRTYGIEVIEVIREKL